MADDPKIDAAFVRDLAEILSEHELAEIEIETEDSRVRLAKFGDQPVPAPMPSMPTPSAVSPPAAPMASASSQAASSASEDVAPSRPSAGMVASPMVGTAYLSPAPGAAPFVQVGASVQEGDTILIIEAMKVMNQIPASRSGTVREILCEDGQPVEFDQPLMIIE